MTKAKRAPNDLNAVAQKHIDDLTLQQLKDAIVAGLHDEGGWKVIGLRVEKGAHPRRYIVSFVAEERE